MYAYEGIGSIYWHMVAKLLLVVQEYCFHTECSISPHIRNEFYRYYYKIRDGLGFNKSPEEYGAFPFDPYSHTPEHSGARQPGMTGQVKEEILTRFGELGVNPEKGRISFIPKLLKKEEFLSSKDIWSYYNLEGKECHIRLEKGCLAFTYCQVPVIYQLTQNEHCIAVNFKDDLITFDGSTLSEKLSQHLIRRSGKISLISVSIPESFLIM